MKTPLKTFPPIKLICPRCKKYRIVSGIRARNDDHFIREAHIIQANTMCKECEGSNGTGETIGAKLTSEQNRPYAMKPKVTLTDESGKVTKLALPRLKAEQALIDHGAKDSGTRPDPISYISQLASASFISAEEGSSADIMSEMAE